MGAPEARERAAWWRAWCPARWSGGFPGAGRAGRDQVAGGLRLAKEAVNAAYETALTQGLAPSAGVLPALRLDDQKEGMAAFMEKRSPDFTGR